jgi:hypothetical protein
MAPDYTVNYCTGISPLRASAKEPILTTYSERAYAIFSNIIGDFTISIQEIVHEAFLMVQRIINSFTNLGFWKTGVLYGIKP